MTDSKLAAALKLAADGFAVFPLAINGKTPAIDGNWRKIATKDPERIRRMWTDPVFDAEMDYNIGIALDRHTLVVDVDTRDGKKGAKSLALLEAINDPLPATYTVETASGGKHFYFHVEDSGSFPKELAEHIDLKGEGGYVVGPGSTIEDRSYRPCGEGEIAAAGWVSHHAATGRRSERNRDRDRPRPLADLDTPDAIKRAIEYLTTRAPEAIEGTGGDQTTYAVAAKVKDFGISQATAYDLISEHWNETKASPPWDEDELERKVGNAYRYGTSPPGIASPEAEFEAVEISNNETGNTAPKKRGLYFITWQDAKPNLEQPYLIDEVMDLGTMVVTYGDSNVGKTYVVLDQCFHIAAGRDWNGKKVKQGLVVYVAAEGGQGFLKRIEAYKRHYEVGHLPFAVVPCPIDLCSENADTRRLTKLIAEVEAIFGQKCTLIIVDTLARAMHGGDENTSVDMGKLVIHCDRLRAATGATINLIHHTGKDKSKGARGSSALRAATDTEIEIDQGLFNVSKQRDLAKLDPLRFELEGIEVGQRSDGKTVTACVVRWVAESEFEERLTPVAEAMLGQLERLIEARREELEDEENPTNADMPKGPEKVFIPWNEWQEACFSFATGPRGKPVNRTVLYRSRGELSHLRLIEKNKQNEWTKR